jgi:NADH-quinone oxidoreductase subunit M
MPAYAFTFMVFTMASVGLPGTSGFVGEFLVLTGAFQSSTLVATLATSGVVLGAAYMLYLYRRVIFGKLEKEDLKSILDLSWREVAVFAPLVVLTFWMGIYPVSFTRPMHVSVVNLVTKYETAQVPRPSTVADARR